MRIVLCIVVLLSLVPSARSADCKNSSGRACLTIPASTREQAAQLATDVVAYDAFRLESGQGMSNPFYSEQFPITEWGRSYLDPEPWGNQSGVMQVIDGLPEEWLDIPGMGLLHHWTVLESPTLGSSVFYRSSHQVWPTEVPYLITLKMGLFSLDEFTGFRVIYSAHSIVESNPIPEPSCLLLLFGFIPMRRRRV